MIDPTTSAVSPELDEIAALRSLVEGTAGSTGEEFFRSLVRNLASALGVRYAFVAEFVARPVHADNVPGHHRPRAGRGRQGPSATAEPVPARRDQGGPQLRGDRRPGGGAVGGAPQGP